LWSYVNSAVLCRFILFSSPENQTISRRLRDVFNLLDFLPCRFIPVFAVFFAEHPGSSGIKSTWPQLPLQER
jgi:hypothetical protein